MTHFQQSPSAPRERQQDPELELEARANVMTALWTNLRYDVATKDRRLSEQQERCEALERELAAIRQENLERREELAAVRQEMKQRTEELERDYMRLWNSRSRLLKRGLRLTFGLGRRKP